MPETYYGDYLKLPKLLDSQTPLSFGSSSPQHDEMLFLVIHQSYELWFKQILFELSSVIGLFNTDNVTEKNLYTCTRRLGRMLTITELFKDHIKVLNTLEPSEFLEFRDHLVPASGFQSLQFRMIEHGLGLKHDARYHEAFVGRLNQEDQKKLANFEAQPNLFQVLDAWLARMPFAETQNYNFWDEYIKSVLTQTEKDQRTLNQNKDKFSKELFKKEQANISQLQKSFTQLLDKKSHDSLVESGQRQFGHKAFINALFIFLYKTEPHMNLPYEVLKTLVHIDENLFLWRQNHRVMAQRMLGSRMGTGGSSGVDYLKKSTYENRLFQDLYQLSGYLVPDKSKPKLPDEILKQLNFQKL